MSYKFKWKRFLFKHSRKVIGHRYEKEQDKMTLFFENGGVREIKNWIKCEAFLGIDWAIAMQKEMEKQSGASVPTIVKG